MNLVVNTFLSDVYKMNKLIISCLVVLLSTQPVFTKPTNKSEYEPLDSSIITPDISTGVQVFDHFNNDTAGNMVIYKTRGMWWKNPNRRQNRKYWFALVVSWQL